jgi:group I intron endonuclease
MFVSNLINFTNKNKYPIIGMSNHGNSIAKNLICQEHINPPCGLTFKGRVSYLEGTEMVRENICGIYWIFNKLNGKCYIGQSVNCESRLRSHRYSLNKNIHRNSYLQRAWNKYGEENFKFEILEECASEELDKLELEWLNYLGGYDDNETYNLGPICGGTVSEKTKEKLRQLNLNMSNSVKDRIRSTVKQHWANGVYADRKISNKPVWNKGLSKEDPRLFRSCRKVGEFKHSEETKIKMSEAHLGKPAQNRKKVLCVETGIIYSSIKEAVELTGITGISQACTKNKTACGFNWRIIHE